MSQIQKDIEKVTLLKEGETCFINWFEEGGGEVVRTEGKLYLREIPSFGGFGGAPLVFNLEDVVSLVETAHSWV